LYGSSRGRAAGVLAAGNTLRLGEGILHRVWSTPQKGGRMVTIFRVLPWGGRRERTQAGIGRWGSMGVSLNEAHSKGLGGARHFPH